MYERIHERADTRLRLSIAVIGAAIAVAGSTTAATSPAQIDASFVDAVRADGHEVPRGTDQQAALVVAARKICARRAPRLTPVERRASALNPRELDTVKATFAGDARGFANLALDTYCPS
jgi:hypothetical protein